MELGLVQYNPVWEDKTRNKEKLKFLLNDIEDNVDALVFPEMTLTGFTMEPEKFAEDLDGESVCFFKDIASDKNLHLFAGIIERDGNKFYNSLLHINNKGELVKFYRKIHPFSYSAEDKHYSRGEKVVVTEVNEWKTGLSVCYDLRFPELYRYYGRERVQLIINIANWPETRIEHWRALLKARAIENQCYVAGVNRVGDDPKLHYNGFSSVFDPMGEEIISSENEEKIITTDLSLDKVEEVQTRLPFLNDIYLLK
ncbi:MAG: nitrilase-related carbon-nitrogen hydrolase [Ignavibacteriaceae bacterium]